MSLLLALSLAAAQQAGPVTDQPKLEPPRELLSCGTDDAIQSRLCRATVAAETGRPVEAAEAFEAAAPLSEDDREQRARIELAAGNMWLLAGEPAKADAAIGRALEYDLYLSPIQRGLARVDRARAAQAQGDVDKALARLEDAEPYAAEDPFLWWMKGSLLLDRGDLAKARTAIDRGLALADDAPELLNLAGMLAQEEGKLDEARRYFTAAATHPDNPSGQAAAAALEAMRESADMEGR